MKIHYTSKLFYKTYAYKITLGFQVTKRNRYHKHYQLQPELQQLQDWCTQQFGTQFKMINRSIYGNQIYSCETSIYVSTESDKDQVLQQYAGQVLEVWQPMDEAHLQALGVRNITQVRTKLIYNKYSHVIYFRYDKKQTLKGQLAQMLADSTQSVVKGCARWPRVYSMCEQDITWIRLTYPEQIDYVKHVILFPT